MLATFESATLGIGLPIPDFPFGSVPEIVFPGVPLEFFALIG
jgi:hypothetical protein